MDENKLFVEKYKPRRLDELISNNKAAIRIKSFVLGNKVKKALLLHGPTGTGKSCSVYALANELGLDVIELNASDYRDKESISAIIRNAGMQGSIFNRGKIILIDEVDNLAGNADRGGVQELTRIIEESSNPMIFIANDVWNEKLNGLRQKCELVEFNKIDYMSILRLLKGICQREEIEVSEENLSKLAKKVDGDLRAAINDLQTLSENGGFFEDNKRDKKESIFNILKAILTGKDVKQIFNVMDNSDVEYDELFLWLDENLAGTYKNKEDLANAYEMMSRADVYRGRIRRQQYYRLIVYVNAMLNLGVALSKDNNVSSISYRRTTRLLKIWRAKAKNAKRKSIAEKYAAYTHTSTKRMIKDFEDIKNIIKNNKIAEELGLSKEEISGI